MWPLTSEAQRALVQSHSMTLRATAYGPYGTRVIPVTGGSVTSDAGSQTRRTATIDTSLALWSIDPRSVIGVYGTEVQVDYGIVIPGRVEPEWVPMIRGLITAVPRRRPIGSGTITLTLVDRSARVAEDKLAAPQQTVSGATVVTEIRRLIQASLGTGVAVVDRTGSAQVAPVMEIEQERWSDGVEKLADAIGAEVYADPTGSFVIRRQPALTDTPMWVVASGPGGILVERDDNLSRDEVFSGVVARGERTDGTTAVQATVWDTDPASPTYHLGPFGSKLKLYTSPLLTTVAQCQTAAEALLARSRGGDAAVTLSAIVNPALEAGDVIVVRDDGVTRAHIVDKVVTPLSPSGAQSMQTRSIAAG